MKIISDYTIYCTREQTKRALELGASIEKERIGKCITENIPHLTTNNEENEYDYLIPTTDQMIGWLEGLGVIDNVDVFKITDLGKRYWVYDLFNSDGDTLCYDDSQFKSRRKATLAAIDAALEYLQNK